MSLPNAVIDAMIAAGCTAEQLAAAVKAANADTEARREAKRANNAERQRRFKARHKPDEVTENNAGNALPSVTGVTTLSRPLSPQTPHTPTHTRENNTPPARKGTPAKPDGVADQTWTDFLDLRKRKRAPLTQTALAGIEREALKAKWSMEAALAKCLARGWQSFEAEWVANSPGPPGQSSDLVKSILAKNARTLEEPTQ